jgi:hypothetical protein
MFAMSIVALLLRWTVAAAPKRRAAPNELASLAELAGADKKPLPARFDPLFFILSPWQYERNRGGKEFFIIVNRLVTMMNGHVVLALGRPQLRQSRGYRAARAESRRLRRL